MLFTRRFVIGPDVALELAARRASIPAQHRLPAPTLLRSQLLAELYGNARLGKLASEASRPRRHDAGDHPVVLAKLRDTLEALVFEHGEPAVVQERGRHGAAFNVLGVALDGAAPERSDLGQGAGKCNRGHALAPVLPVDEEAGDAPVRAIRKREFVVGAPVLDARQLQRRHRGESGASISQ